MIFSDQFECDTGMYRCSLPYVLFCYCLPGFFFRIRGHWGELTTDNYCRIRIGLGEHLHFWFIPIGLSYFLLHFADEHGSSIGHAQHFCKIVKFSKIEICDTLLRINRTSIGHPKTYFNRWFVYCWNWKRSLRNKVFCVKKIPFLLIIWPPRLPENNWNLLQNNMTPKIKLQEFSLLLYKM